MRVIGRRHRPCPPCPVIPAKAGIQARMRLPEGRDRVWPCIIERRENYDGNLSETDHGGRGVLRRTAAGARDRRRNRRAVDVSGAPRSAERGRATPSGPRCSASSRWRIRARGSRTSACTRRRRGNGAARARGRFPERGVVEVKAADDDAWLTAEGAQVTRYWNRYRLVLVTNTRDFVLVGQDTAGNAVKLETFRLTQYRRGIRATLGNAPRVRTAGRRGAGRVPVPRAVAKRGHRRPERPRLAAGLLRPRRPCACRSGGRCALADHLARGAGGGTRRSLRGRARRCLLPFDAGADAVLRHLLRLGAVGEADPAPNDAVRLAYGGLASARAGFAGVVSTDLRPRPAAAAGPCGSAGLDGGSAQPGGHGRFL